tara:strand:+ start:90 stop:377 length:288 start_codon:yes stop_codon:yes gene_type:complete
MNEENIKPVVGWITKESMQRLSKGGNSSRGTVPMHQKKSVVAYIPVHIGVMPEPSTQSQAERIAAELEAIALRLNSNHATDNLLRIASILREPPQ